MEGKEGDPVFNGSCENPEKALLFTDWEGPWVLNDFAYELCLAILNNERFFRNLSEYDDYLFYFLKKESYEAGYTLKLLIPFISAYGVDEKTVDRLINSAVFVPDAKKAGKRILSNFEPVVISTAYKRFVERTAEKLGFRKVHGSEAELSIDLDPVLKKRLVEAVDIVSSLRGEELYNFLEELFSGIWHRLSELKVIGAKEKAEILEMYEPEAPIVIGDSITDCKMFEKAKKLGGIAIAFNGNRYALEKADLAIVSNTALSTAIVTETLLKGGMDLSLVKAQKYPMGTKVYIMEESDFEIVLENSMRMRVKLRGSAGSLG
ncbi:MAG: hypothetical protein PWQ22_208 [Archaeoglobaceae archaeon]|nr:hypothetical protein [Archaeoglobaceae archaeon]